MSDEAIKAALAEARKAHSMEAAVFLFLRALPSGGVWVNGGSITAPRQVAEAVRAAAIEREARDDR